MGECTFTRPIGSAWLGQYVACFLRVLCLAMGPAAELPSGGAIGNGAKDTCPCIARHIYSKLGVACGVFQ